MKTNTAEAYLRPASAEAVRPVQAGGLWFAGGTWLLTEHLPEFPGLDGCNPPNLAASAEGLEIGTACTIRELAEFIAPRDWIAAPLLKDCSRSLMASAGDWHKAGGCGPDSAALPLGALISLATALDGVCTLWPPHGSPRELPVAEFIAGNFGALLGPGEVLHSIWIPASALKKHHTLRRFSLTASGRSSVLLVGTLCPVTGVLTLTITAAMAGPVRLVFPDFPSAMAIHLAINEHVAFDHHREDPHGSPLHRRHLTYHYAEKILHELSMI
jgi:CO/xanthine dehydrogenase FAD-binding subunit